MLLSQKESLILLNAYKQAFNLKKCIRDNKDKDDPKQYCNKTKFYVDNQLGWPRKDDTIRLMEEKLRNKGNKTPIKTKKK